MFQKDRCSPAAARKAAAEIATTNAMIPATSDSSVTGSGVLAILFHVLAYNSFFFIFSMIMAKDMKDSMNDEKGNFVFEWFL